jgi:hypothetical protein
MYNLWLASTAPRISGAGGVTSAHGVAHRRRSTPKTGLLARRPSPSCPTTWAGSLTPRTKRALPRSVRRCGMIRLAACQLHVPAYFNTALRRAAARRLAVGCLWPTGRQDSLLGWRGDLEAPRRRLRRAQRRTASATPPDAADLVAAAEDPLRSSSPGQALRPAPSARFGTALTSEPHGHGVTNDRHAETTSTVRGLDSRGISAPLRRDGRHHRCHHPCLRLRRSATSPVQPSPPGPPWLDLPAHEQAQRRDVLRGTPGPDVLRGLDADAHRPRRTSLLLAGPETRAWTSTRSRPAPRSRLRGSGECRLRRERRLR